MLENGQPAARRNQVEGLVGTNGGTPSLPYQEPWQLCTRLI